MKPLEKYQAKRAIENEETDETTKRIRSKKFLKKGEKADDSYVATETEAQSEGKLKALLKKLES